MNTILLTGKTGQIGWELQRTLAPLGRVVALDREQMDLTNADSIRTAIREVAPNVIVNAAGFTIVDKAETGPELAMQVNGIAPGIMAEEARRIGALLVHYSTTFVFDGTKSGPYVETDPPAPINVYGRTKLAGEEAITACGGDHIILRANWTYSVRRTNFVLTLLRLAQEKDELAIVDDQFGSPTWARAYAEATAKLLAAGDEARNRGGIYHLSAGGQTSRYEFARIIIDTANGFFISTPKWARLRPITTAEYPLPAARPHNSVTSNTKLRKAFGIQMPHWNEQLDAFFVELFSAQSSGMVARPV